MKDIKLPALSNYIKHNILSGGIEAHDKAYYPINLDFIQWRIGSG